MKRSSTHSTPFSQAMQQRHQQAHGTGASKTTQGEGRAYSSSSDVSFLPRISPHGSRVSASSSGTAAASTEVSLGRMANGRSQRLSSSLSPVTAPITELVANSSEGGSQQRAHAIDSAAQPTPVSQAAQRRQGAQPLSQPAAPQKTLSAKTPPKELLAVISELQKELSQRTDNINAIQRNFERLSTMYRADAKELSRLRAELMARQEADAQAKKSNDNVSNVLQAELQREMEEAKNTQATVDLLRREKEKLLARCQDADETLKAFQHEKRQLASEADSLGARLMDVEELLADTQRECANERTLKREQSEVFFAMLATAVTGVVSLLSASPADTAGAAEMENGGAASLSTLQGEKAQFLSAVDDRGLNGGCDFATQLLATYVAPEVQRLHERCQRDERQWEQQKSLLVLQAQLPALLEGEQALRDVRAEAERESRALLRGFLALTKQHEEKCEGRVASALAASTERWRATREAENTTRQESEEAVRARYEAQLAALRGEMEELRCAAAAECSLAVAGAQRHAEEECTQALSALAKKHQCALEKLETTHQSALAALREEQAASSGARVAEMAELQRVIAQYTTQLERQEELFATLQQRHSSEMSHHDRRVEEQIASAVDAAVREARDRCTADAAAALCVVNEQFSERFACIAEEHAGRTAMLVGFGQQLTAQSTGDAVARTKVALVSDCRKALAEKATLASALVVLIIAESDERTALVEEFYAERLTWLTPNSQVSLLQQRAADSQRLAHKAEIEALRKAAERREENVTSKLSELRRELHEAMEERDAMTTVNGSLRGQLKTSSDALCASTAQLAEHQKTILGSVQRVLAAEEASESAYSCSLCFQLFERPRTCAPCGHSFCERCLFTHPRNRDQVARGTAASPTQPLYCPECGVHNASAVVEPKPLELLAGKFHYRKQALQEIVRYYQQLQ